jgi:hypothetical protein
VKFIRILSKTDKKFDLIFFILTRRIRIKRLATQPNLPIAALYQNLPRIAFYFLFLIFFYSTTPTVLLGMLSPELFSALTLYFNLQPVG